MLFRELMTEVLRPSDWLKGAQTAMDDALKKIGKKAKSQIGQDRKGKFLFIETDELEIFVRYTGDPKLPWDVSWYGIDNGKKMKFSSEKFDSAAQVIQAIF